LRERHAFDLDEQIASADVAQGEHRRRSAQPFGADAPHGRTVLGTLDIYPGQAQPVQRRAEPGMSWAARLSSPIRAAMLSSVSCAWAEALPTWRFRHEKAAKAVEITLTGSGEKVELRVLLPKGARRVARATVDGRPATEGVQTVEKSRYAVLSVELSRPRKVRITYG
jgi:hypothetical protein